MIKDEDLLGCLICYGRAPVQDFVTRTSPIFRVSLRVFKEQLEGGYKFEKAGTYRFVFKVGKPNSLLAGKAMTRTVVVTE